MPQTHANHGQESMWSLMGEPGSHNWTAHGPQASWQPCKNHIRVFIFLDRWSSYEQQPINNSEPIPRFQQGELTNQPTTKPSSFKRHNSTHGHVTSGAKGLSKRCIAAMMAMALACFTDGFFGVFFYFRTKGLRTTREIHVTRLSEDVQRDEGILPMILVFFVLFFSCATLWKIKCG